MFEWERSPDKECGVITGCDCAQEWLLEWWWERYSAENAFPVTFIDFGMSSQIRDWCRERGELIVVDLDMSFVKSKEEIDPQLADLWDSWVDRWDSRKAWFKKPFALLHSPYRKGIWLDLDCEVLGPLDALFSECTLLSQVAMARERKMDLLPRFHPNLVYNGGVIAFLHGSEIIQKWAKAAVTRNHCFFGDDFLLSALIQEEGLEIVELAEIFNWRIVKGINLDAVIVHWVGAKNYIKECRGIKPSLDHFYRAIQK